MLALRLIGIVFFLGFSMIAQPLKIENEVRSAEVLKLDITGNCANAGCLSAASTAAVPASSESTFAVVRVFSNRRMMDSFYQPRMALDFNSDIDLSKYYFEIAATAAERLRTVDWRMSELQMIGVNAVTTTVIGEQLSRRTVRGIDPVYEIRQKFHSDLISMDTTRFGDCILYVAVSRPSSEVILPILSYLRDKVTKSDLTVYGREDAFFPNQGSFEPYSPVRPKYRIPSFEEWKQHKTVQCNSRAGKEPKCVELGATMK